MNSHEKFYRHCYQRTNGWIPMMPLGSELELGDFAQIHNSQFLPLGNIFNLKNFPDYAHQRPPIEVSDELKLNREDWQMSDGIEIKAAYRQRTDVDSEGLDRESDLERDRSIWFAERGSFSFNSRVPRAKFILNWSQIKPIIKLGLTLLEHSFREVYVVTRIASVEHWELAIANTVGAELEVKSKSCDVHERGLNYYAAGDVQHSSGLDVYQAGSRRPAHFFQAKKLTMSSVKRDHYMREILDQQGELPDHIIANLLKTNLFNQVKRNELNRARFDDEEQNKYDKKNEPCCKLDVAPYFEYFEWTDISLDDVEKLY